MRPTETLSEYPSSSRSASPAATRQGVVVAIPARWGSTRLPGKPLLDLAGKPMIEHVYRRAAAARGPSRVVVLTDDERIMQAVARFGGEAELTPRDCPSGTDRIAVAARGWTAAAVINVQGDEPLIDPAVIEAVAARIVDPEEEIVTVATPAQLDELDDPHVVKVVVGQDGRALYFSRACIPHHRDPGQTANTTGWKHLGIYGYRHDVLLHLASLAPTPLEQAESLEQLRALEHGIKIRVLTVDRAESGVDTVRDLARVTARLAGDSHGPAPIKQAPIKQEQIKQAQIKQTGSFHDH